MLGSNLIFQIYSYWSKSSTILQVSVSVKYAVLRISFIRWVLVTYKLSCVSSINSYLFHCIFTLLSLTSILSPKMNFVCFLLHVVTIPLIIIIHNYPYNFKDLHTILDNVYTKIYIVYLSLRKIATKTAG